MIHWQRCSLINFHRFSHLGKQLAAEPGRNTINIEPGRKTFTVELEGNKTYTQSPAPKGGLVINANEAQMINMQLAALALEMKELKVVAVAVTAQRKELAEKVVAEVVEKVVAAQRKELAEKAVREAVAKALAKVVAAQKKKSFGIGD